MLQSEVTEGAGENSIQEFSTDLLKVYYGRLFPYDDIFNWLSYGNDPSKESPYIERDFYGRREWSFTIEDDIYIRYQSFKDKNEMINAIQKRQPHKIDIGAVFTAPPKDHAILKPELFKTTERELVFDIDMTDYDDIRTCCTGANICLKCWPYMTMALKVVDRSLRDDFGFKNILWVYSGRRGIHCWCCDREARLLQNDARAAIIDYLSVHTGSSENSDKKIKQSFSQMHPMIKRSYGILEPYFAKYIVEASGQGLLARKDRCMKVLNSIPNENIRKELYALWEKDLSITPNLRWRQIVDSTTAPQSISASGVKRRKVDYAELEAWRYELVFTHCYPRLDANVSKTQNHLLKSPFCIHPKTGRVCVPIDPAMADAFNPFDVPTVRTLCAEIDAYDRVPLSDRMATDGEPAEDGSGKVRDMDKTALKESVDVFHKVFLSELLSATRKIIRDKADKVAAVAVDF